MRARRFLPLSSLWYCELWSKVLKPLHCGFVQGLRASLGAGTRSIPPWTLLNKKPPQNHLASQISGGSYQYYCCTTMIPSRTGCQPRSGGHFLSLQRSRPRRNTPLCTLPGLIVLYLQGIFLAFGPQISRLSGTNWHVTIIWRCHGTEILLNLIWSPGSCSRVPPLP